MDSSEERVSSSGLAWEDRKSSLAGWNSGPARQGCDGCWLFRGLFVALICLEKQCLGVFRGPHFGWLFRGPHFGQILRVLAVVKFSESCHFCISVLLLDFPVDLRSNICMTLRETANHITRPQKREWDFRGVVYKLSI